MKSKIGSPSRIDTKKCLRDGISAPRKLDTKDTNKCGNSPNKVELIETVEGIEIMEIAYFLSFGVNIQDLQRLRPEVEEGSNSSAPTSNHRERSISKYPSVTTLG